MQVTAYPVATAGQPAPKSVLLGDIAVQIWINGFKFTEERKIQVVTPINAPYPSLFDRNTSVENFSFAAGQSFATVGAALVFLATHPAGVPRLCDLEFIQDGKIVWLRSCGIPRIELVQKNGALVVFGYTIIGGYWSLT